MPCCYARDPTQECLVRNPFLECGTTCTEAGTMPELSQRRIHRRAYAETLHTALARRLQRHTGNSGSPILPRHE